jgi:hypothetical protein
VATKKRGNNHIRMDQTQHHLVKKKMIASLLPNDLHYFALTLPQILPGQNMFTCLFPVKFSNKEMRM